MENIVGINEVRPKLTFLLEALGQGDAPYIITIKSEPRGVLLSYDEYRRLRQVEQEQKRLSLRLAMERIRTKALSLGLTETDIALEIEEDRKGR
ncbi:MAG: type II toxin-antitoxin system prevent-host-death family antitoxin [Desulforudis sp.]|jgi:prevent-host-death family protein|nr:type II toxin-antitoxin system Phd/YefM family antitoxin [Clostridia bacterium]RJX20331.1 MAG: type II toxin-antitoxin system prevent-host-death family antitoxin [Desulforudis sp.]